MNSAIIIPALNPDQKLISLVKRLREMDTSLIVIVNDGSRTNCSPIFDKLESEYHCAICQHPENRGKGAALKTGIRYAASIYPQCAGYVTADADGQHTPEDIVRVAEVLEKNPRYLVLGTRNFSERNVPFKSRWGNRITSWVFRQSTGVRCPDTQTGLRGIPSEFTAACLAVPGDRFEYEMNMLLEAAGEGVRFLKVPIATVYLENNRSSHFHAVKDSFRIYANILKFALPLPKSGAKQKIL